MAKMYHFYRQPASNECPAVPRAVSVWGESMGDATKVLAQALKDDAKLEQKHPEFEKPEEKAHTQKVKK